MGESGAKLCGGRWGWKRGRRVAGPAAAVRWERSRRAAAPAPCAGGSRPKGGTACGPMPAPCRGIPRERGPAGRGGFAGAERGGRGRGKAPCRGRAGGRGRGKAPCRNRAARRATRPEGGFGGGLRPPPTAAKPPALRACVLPIWQGAVSGGAFVLEPAQKFAEGAATLCILAADMIR